MKHFPLSWFICFALLLTATSTTLAQKDFPAISPGDWPWWRGPNFNGIVSDQKVVLEWSETQNILWKAPVPGRGHASPIVVGSRVFLSTADEERNLQSVLCYDRADGKEIWRKDLHEGGFDGRWHKKNTRASSTLACDGERVFAVFYNEGSIWATALDLEGKQLWQEKLGKFVSHWGYSASPTLYRSLVIIATDHREGGALFGLDRRTGKLTWEASRPSAPTYASPVVLNVAGKDQLVIAGAEQVVSYDPHTGKALWSVKGTSTECVSTIISEGDRIFATGGFPAKETLCIRADGSGEVVWRVKVGDFVPSQLVHKGYLYSILDNGVALCWNANTGQEMWKDRLSSPAFSASPILVGEHIFIPSETGKTHVFKASPDKLEIVAENTLGKEIYASPVVATDRLYLRVVTAPNGKKQEMLYCIGKKGP
jgi:outer membrane protein assembly factor BamB